jgi:hypothetical protein
MNNFKISIIFLVALASCIGRLGAMYEWKNGTLHDFPEKSKLIICKDENSKHHTRFIKEGKNLGFTIYPNIETTKKDEIIFSFKNNNIEYNGTYLIKHHSLDLYKVSYNPGPNAIEINNFNPTLKNDLKDSLKKFANDLSEEKIVLKDNNNYNQKKRCENPSDDKHQLKKIKLNDNIDDEDSDN